MQIACNLVSTALYVRSVCKLDAWESFLACGYWHPDSDSLDEHMEI